MNRLHRRQQKVTLFCAYYCGGEKKYTTLPRCRLRWDAKTSQNTEFYSSQRDRRFSGHAYSLFSAQ